jgi:hypothetical protein
MGIVDRDLGVLIECFLLEEPFLLFSLSRGMVVMDRGTYNVVKKLPRLARTNN